MRVDLAAHVKWFTDPVAHPTDWSLLATAPVLIAFAIAIAAVGLAYAIQRRVPEPKIVSIPSSASCSSRKAAPDTSAGLVTRA